MGKLELNSLGKSFGEETAVNNLSATVQDGHIKTFLGPSGCGKTTTLRCIAGLERLDSGEISINGRTVSAPKREIHVPPAERGVGMVFQNYAVWPHMTVKENVSFPLEQRGDIGTKERERRVKNIVELVDIEEHMNNLVPNLSGGQQQRVSLARALVNEPDLLLLDEPLSNLDAALRKEMRQEIRRICDDIGVTMMYVTHSQDEALYLSDELAIMNNGEIVEQGKPSKLHQSPDSYFSMTFLGECNFLPGTVDSLTDSYILVDSDAGPLKARRIGEDVEIGDTLRICFRPKYVEVADQKLNGENSLEGTIIDSSMTTDFFEYTIRVNEATFQVQTVREFGTATDDVFISIEPEDIRVFKAESEDRPRAAPSTSSATTSASSEGMVPEN